MDRTTGATLVVFALLLAGCSAESRGPDDVISRDAATTCSLVPEDVASELLGTSRRTVADTPLRSGTNDQESAATCTLSSKAESDHFLRVSIRIGAESEAAKRRTALTSGEINRRCVAPRRYAEKDGVGLSCSDDIGDATTTRVVTVWGRQLITTQVTRPGPALTRDPDLVWEMALEAHERFVDNTPTNEPAG